MIFACKITFAREDVLILSERHFKGFGKINFHTSNVTHVQIMSNNLKLDVQFLSVIIIIIIIMSLFA